MFSQDAVELFPSEEDDESMTLDPEERKAVRKRLEKADALEKAAREVKERLRRTQEELRRIKASAPFLAASDLTAEAGGVPTSRVFYRRPLDPVSLTGRVDRRVTRDARGNVPSPTRRPSDFPSNGVRACGTRLGESSRSVGGR